MKLRAFGALASTAASLSFAETDRRSEAETAEGHPLRWIILSKGVRMRCFMTRCVLMLFFGLSFIASYAAAGEIATPDTEGFKPLFNGENWDGWYLKLRSGDPEMAKKVFSIEDGMVHVFNKNFPSEYNLNTGANDTHGLFYTKKKYSKYILRFEYKWGTRIANNFGEWQYDAGCYYHVADDKVWPVGIEYQVRYNQVTKRNHTGDLIRPGGADYLWFPSADGKTFLHPNQGGKETEVKGWLHFTAETDNFNALNNEWNQCEIIVMGDQYVIHKLNGDIVNMATNLKPAEGIIGLQSETAEIYYRNIEIKEFDQIIPMETFLK